VFHMQGEDADQVAGSFRSPGQVVMGVAIKLVVEMWLTAGPAVSLPLALLLLRRCYGSPRPALRRRAFDLLANLMVGAPAATPLKATSVCSGASVCRQASFSA
jgi:hypothetical protein